MILNLEASRKFYFKGPKQEEKKLAPDAVRRRGL